MCDGMANLEHIARDAVDSHGEDPGSIHSYLRDSLHYTLGAREMRGVETFQKLCLRYNMLQSARELTLAPDAVVQAQEPAPGVD